MKRYLILTVCALGLLVSGSQAQDLFSDPVSPQAPDSGFAAPVPANPVSPWDDTPVTPAEPAPSGGWFSGGSEPAAPAEPEIPLEPEFKKEMVTVPPPAVRKRLEAGDFRDPFFFVRGYQPDADNPLEPGTTFDGIRFNAYRDNAGFVERYYRDSNFVLEDVFGRIQLDNREGGCLTCHRGIEKISGNHDFRCVQCHRGNSRARTMSSAHAGLVSNPSDLENAPRFCGKCHQDQISKVQSSLMTTNRGLIEITRHAWGAPPLEQPKTIAQKKTSRSKTNDEVPDTWTYNSQDHQSDDFLEKKCLRCHVQGVAPHRAGDYRATGCAACHMVYTNDGLTLSRDRAIQRKQKSDLRRHPNRFEAGHAANSLGNSRGYPLVHQFTVAVPSVQCEHCHNHNGVGNEFEGLFGKPARPRAAAQVNGQEPVLYGRQHDFLVPDIHREKGMHCIDCHDSAEMKADSTLSADQQEAVRIRCTTCHGTNNTPPEPYQLVASDPRTDDLLKKNGLNPNLARKIKTGEVLMTGPGGEPMPHVVNRNNEWILISKVTGKEHKIPVLKFLKRMPLPHQVGRHMTAMECSACHARWSASEWGLHAIREDAPNLDKWKNWNFSDPSLQQLNQAGASAPGQTGTLNWREARQTPNGVIGPKKPGIWRDVFSEATWNVMMLGKNQRGNYTILKPRYQYFISDPSAQPPMRARVPQTLNSSPGLVMTPHSPHTIRREARTCESCHQNSVAAGWGDPNLLRVRDGKAFHDALDNENRVLPDFQIKQTVAGNGIPLQIILPGQQTRFLKNEEIKSLFKTDDKYKAYRYMDLRRQSLPRFTLRQTYPYDQEHQATEKSLGEPDRREELLYYDLNRRQFALRKPAPPPPPAPPSPMQTGPDMQVVIPPGPDLVPSVDSRPPETPRGGEGAETNPYEDLFDAGPSQDRELTPLSPTPYPR